VSGNYYNIWEMKNIVLTGFMGTGKTAVGKELARLLHMTLVDVDAEIERSEKMKISEIFKKSGEARFREIETEMIRAVAQQKHVIISTGGGAVLKQANIDVLKRNGLIVCLSATPETIFRRTRAHTHRPLLQVENPLDRIRDLLSTRIPHYEKADITIDTENRTPLEIAQEIRRKVRDAR
jgi:shikimate kinase